MMAGLLLAAGLLCVLAGTSLAATSEACLRRCLSTCPALDKDKGEACLRSCLKDCPVHCGTVDMDCAVDWLKRTPAVSEAEQAEPVGEPWEATSRRSPAAMRVSRCAEACRVKPDCRPTAYDTGPAELSGAPKAPPVPKTQPARQAQPVREKRFEPKGRYFSLALPQDILPQGVQAPQEGEAPADGKARQGWRIEEQDRLASGGVYELSLLTKGAAFLDYTLISVRYAPGPHRTAERFRFDLEHPDFRTPAGVSANATAMVKTSLSGAEAWRAESHGVRTLLGNDDSVPLLKRTLLLPQAAGYFVLTLETPEAFAEANSQVFERLAESFRPQLKARPREPELSVQERAVWAGFFSSAGKLELAGRAGVETDAEAGAPPPIDPGFGQPQQYLTDTAKTRLVGGRTLAAPGIDKDALAGLLRGCGGQGTDKDLAAQALALAQTWDAVRGQQVLVTDEILLPGPGGYGLKVQEKPKPDRGGAAQPELLDGPGRQGRMSRPGGLAGMALSGGVATLSRVAFNAAGDLALAYVAHGQTSPGTSHFLLLRRTADGSGGHWTLCGAGQHDMIIF